jgi:tripartite-type tricarboxylate transporter receptor subunit TctC
MRVLGFQIEVFGQFARRAIFALFSGVSLSFVSPSVLAQNTANYPERPIRIVVPFAAGGGTDLIARTLGASIGKDLGQSVVIENKPGAGTLIGSDLVAKSPPDGYHLLIATFANAVNPGMVARMPYQWDKAFAPVALIGKGPNVLVVRSDSGLKSVQDVLREARANPGKLTYASQGNATSAHLAGEMFASLAKVELTHVPYRGAAPAIADLLGGQVDMSFATAAAVGALIDSGKLRALGVTTPERSPALKNVPAIAETVPGYQVESWYGFYVPAGTPEPIVQKLHAATRRATRGEDFAKKVEAEGLVIAQGAPAELDQFVRTEEARWRKLVKDNNIKPD